MIKLLAILNCPQTSYQEKTIAILALPAIRIKDKILKKYTKDDFELEPDESLDSFLNRTAWIPKEYIE